MNPALFVLACARLIVEALIAATVRELAQQLPQPATPPAPTERETQAVMHASALAGRLWDRYRDPSGDLCLTQHGRRMAVLYAAVLDDESVRWLAAQIRYEFADGPDQPPVSHEVFL